MRAIESIDAPALKINVLKCTRVKLISTFLTNQFIYVLKRERDGNNVTNVFLMRV